MKRLFSLLLISILLSLLSQTGHAFLRSTDEVRPLIREEYYGQTHQAIKNAKESINMVMYGILLGTGSSHPVNTLVNDLIAAHRRGVEVKVILEKPRDESTIPNQKAYELLKEAGVKVRFDKEARVTHNKLIIVDRYITILGSHNWTYTALKVNNESSVLIKSRSVAESFLRYLKMTAW